MASCSPGIEFAATAVSRNTFTACEAESRVDVRLAAAAALSCRPFTAFVARSRLEGGKLNWQ